MQGLRKRFAGSVVLDGLDLELRDGEMLALVGVNGAGKTTCLKALLDFIDLDAGGIAIHGVDHTSAAARSGLHFLPERFLPPYFLTGEDFLRYSAALHAVEHRPAAVHEVVDDLELDRAALSRPVRLYSKGMAQKLGLAAALLSGRRLLVLDEPMSGLDPRARLRVKQRLLAERSAGRTLLLTTHMLADVQSLCDRMVILHRGRAAFAGSPAECLARHAGDDLEEAFLNCLQSA